jgi:prophage DNA circulation protein
VQSSISQVVELFGQDEDAATAGTNIDARHRLNVTMAAFRQLDGFADDEAAVDVVDDQSEIESEAKAAYNDAIRALVLAETCNALAALDFDSADAASDVLDTLSDAIDELSNTTDDGIYASVQDLKASLYEHLTSTAATLPRVSTFIPQQTLPVLVIAHMLYNDPRREAEIIDRNQMEHPGFAIGGAELKVLSRG